MLRSLGHSALSVLVFFAMMFTASFAHAQFRTSVQGTVTDSTGAVIPGATLTLKNNATNETVVHTSNDAGVFNFNALPADNFTLTVDRSGFQEKVLDNLQFIPEQANSLNVQLAVAGTTQQVTVNASTEPAVDQETSNIGGTISSNDINHMPSMNRDVFTLTQLAPGVISDGAQGSGGGVYNAPGNQGPGGSGNGGQFPTENGPQANANGQQYETNGISIDGISTVSAVWGGTTVITPNEDSIANVRIVTNDYDAENGRFSGAQTLVTSKSGTNHFHGSAYISVHRPGLNAYQRGTGTGQPIKDTARFNQYGGSIGGPILKNKIFAFFAYESSPNDSTTTGSGWYETPAFDALAPTGSIASKFLTFPGSGVSQTGIITNNETCTTVGLIEGVNCVTIAGQGLNIGSPLTTPLGTQDPTATGTSVNPGIGSGLSTVADIADYSISYPSTSYYKQYNGRLDADVTQKDHLAFAIYWVPIGNTDYNGGSRAYNLFHHSQINDAFSVIYNRTFTPTFLNEARANAAGWRWNEIASNPQQPVGLPDDQVNGLGSISINQFGSSLGSVLNQWTYGYKDVATKIIAAQTIKFGADFTNLHYLNDPIGRPNYSFYNIWDFLNDAPSAESGNFNTATGYPGGTRQDDRENLFGAFVQDDWKIRSNLTLHAGIRYSYFGPLYTKQNNLSVVEFGTGSALYTGINIRVGGNLYRAQKGNVGPQLGFNWAPVMFHNKLTVRGGYGLNFNQEEIAISASAGSNPPVQGYYNFSFSSPTNPGVNGGDIIYGISSSPTSLNGFASNPNTITSYNSANLPTAGNANLAAFGNYSGGLSTPYAEHYSLDTEYEIGNQLVASLGYEGSTSHHLINHETPNAPAVVLGVPLNPLVTGGDYWTNSGSANNNAMLAELKHPMAHHFSADAQFMWAKSMDTDGSGPYSEDPYFPLSPGYSYGRSDFNIGKSLKVFGVWEPVIFHGNSKWLEKILGEWTLSGIFNAHTGFPYSPNFGIGQSLYCQNCGYYNLRPTYLGGAGKSHSNKAFETGSDFAGLTSSQVVTTALVNPSAICRPPNVPTPGCFTTTQYSNKYFSTPNFESAMTFQGTGFPSPNQALPPLPGADRNSFDGPNYRDLDASLTKGFGIPSNRILGNEARVELRADFFNLFNLLNLNPQSVNNNVNSGNFGQDTSALGARTISFQARFSF
ncbi:MAG: TonB-dependent receptor [Acidobacteriaceae bacterium]